MIVFRATRAARPAGLTRAEGAAEVLADATQRLGGRTTSRSAAQLVVDDLGIAQAADLALIAVAVIRTGADLADRQAGKGRTPGAHCATGGKEGLYDSKPGLTAAVFSEDLFP